MHGPQDRGGCEPGDISSACVLTRPGTRAALQYTYYARFARGAADLAGLDSRFRSLNVYGTYDLDRRFPADPDLTQSVRPRILPTT